MYNRYPYLFMIGVDKMRRKTVATIEKILLRVAIYIRVSTDRQVKEGDSMRGKMRLARGHFTAVLLRRQMIL